ncbi:hypothetical protein ACN22W_37600 [Burkholderia theae]|uniref:hypothetical protein n=1 Tax=Burkholderia theae TaxID=3143496 RepID=UPI003AFA80BD
MHTQQASFQMAALRQPVATGAGGGQTVNIAPTIRGVSNNTYGRALFGLQILPWIVMGGGNASGRPMMSGIFWDRRTATRR